MHVINLTSLIGSCAYELLMSFWKHDNRPSGHAFLYVRTARFLMYIYGSWCIYTNLAVYIRILMYIYESRCIYTNLDVYIRISMYIYEFWCIYMNLDVYITVLLCKFMILLFCPFLTSIPSTHLLYPNECKLLDSTVAT